MDARKKEIILTAADTDQALQAGCAYLKIKPAEAEYQVLGKEGDLYKVRVFIPDKNNQGPGSNAPDSQVNGYFKIHYFEGQAFLTVFPPGRDGRPVYKEDVENRMKILNIPWVSPQLISGIIRKSSGKPEPLTDWPEGAEYRPSFEIEIADDKMSASAILRPALRSGDRLEYKDIVLLLEEKNICFGLDTALIKSMLQGPVYNKKEIIARGQPCEAGDSGSIVYFFDINPGKPFLTDKSGRVNLKELNFIQNKKSGEVLALKNDPRPGKKGQNILGEEILPPEVLSRELSAGENVELSADGKQLTALMDGHVFLKDEVIHVKQVVELDNVDNSTGNIDFDGCVLIKGTITDGFTLRAAGTIQVNDCVGRVTIESGEDVVLKAGINANNEGTITCRGNLYTRFIEGAGVECEGSIFAEEAIMHSHISAAKDVILKGRRAELLGGHSVIGRQLVCKKIGSIIGVNTKIYMGIEPAKYRILGELKKNTLLNRRRIETLELEKHKQEKEKNSRKVQEIENLLERLKDETRHSEKEYKEAQAILLPSGESAVIVEEKMFNGVQIHFGHEEYKVTSQEKSRIVLTYKNHKIIEKGINEV